MDKTTADYVAIAISPVLISLLVGSLVFFLLEVLYSGRFDGRLRWVLFWFVPASVLVARIAIERGREQAFVFGLGLAAATSLVMLRFIDGFAIPAILLLGFIWWCADRLTFDCTLIDEKADASGQGLLDAAGLDDSLAGDADADNEETATEKPARTPLWKRVLLGGGNGHSPGLWVVYFSLAALPLFGLGRLMISGEESKDYSFNLLVVYVAAGLGLLLTTSFLGLRRYLRQRRLQMPSEATSMWMLYGGGIILAILLIATLLPRPDAQYSLTALLDKVGSPDLEASPFSFLKGDGADDERDDGVNQEDAENQGDRPGENGKSGGREGQKGQGGGQNKSDDGSPSDGDKGESGGEQKGESDDESGDSDDDGKTGEKGKSKRGRNQKGGNRGREEKGRQGNNRNGRRRADSGSSSSNSRQSDTSFVSKVTGFIAQLVKWLLYLGIALFVAWLIYKNRHALLAAWRNLLARLFRRKKDQKSGEAEDDEGPEPSYRPFRSYADPFLTGKEQSMSNAKLVAYTFEALEAWAREQGLARATEETPSEFARRLAKRTDAFGPELQTVIGLYSRLAYANKAPRKDCREPVRLLWHQLAEAEAQPVTG